MRDRILLRAGSIAGIQESTVSFSRPSSKGSGYEIVDSGECMTIRVLFCEFVPLSFFFETDSMWEWLSGNQLWDPSSQCSNSSLIEVRSWFGVSASFSTSSRGQSEGRLSTSSTRMGLLHLWRLMIGEWWWWWYGDRGEEGKILSGVLMVGRWSQMVAVVAKSFSSYTDDGHVRYFREEMKKEISSFLVLSSLSSLQLLTKDLQNESFKDNPMVSRDKHMWRIERFQKGPVGNCERIWTIHQRRHNLVSKELEEFLLKLEIIRWYLVMVWLITMIDLNRGLCTLAGCVFIVSHICTLKPVHVQPTHHVLISRWVNVLLDCQFFYDYYKKWTIIWGVFWQREPHLRNFSILLIPVITKLTKQVRSSLIM